MKVPKKKWDRKFEDIFPNASKDLFARSKTSEDLKVFGIDLHEDWNNRQKTADQDVNFSRVSGYETSYVQDHESSRRMRRRLARVMGKHMGL